MAIVNVLFEEFATPCVIQVDRDIQLWDEAARGGGGYHDTTDEVGVSHGTDNGSWGYRDVTVRVLNNRTYTVDTEDLSGRGMHPADDEEPEVTHAEFASTRELVAHLRRDAPRRVIVIPDGVAVPQTTAELNTYLERFHPRGSQ